MVDDELLDEFSHRAAADPARVGVALLDDAPDAPDDPDAAVEGPPPCDAARIIVACHWVFRLRC